MRGILASGKSSGRTNGGAVLDLLLSREDMMGDGTWRVIRDEFGEAVGDRLVGEARSGTSSSALTMSEGFLNGSSPRVGEGE